MSESDQRHYAKVKADPVAYAAYLKRKARERAKRPEYERNRKAKWRAKNKKRCQEIRRAGHAVEAALVSGALVRPNWCSDCGRFCKPEAHHYKGYARKFWLVIEWLCVFCHRRAHRIAS